VAHPLPTVLFYALAFYRGTLFREAEEGCVNAE